MAPFRLARPFAQPQTVALGLLLVGILSSGLVSPASAQRNMEDDGSTGRQGDNPANVTAISCCKCHIPAGNVCINVLDIEVSNDPAFHTCSDLPRTQHFNMIMQHNATSVRALIQDLNCSDTHIYTNDECNPVGTGRGVCPANPGGAAGSGLNGAAPLSTIAGAPDAQTYSNVGITEQAQEFRSLKPILAIPIPGVTFGEATLVDGKVTVPFLAQYIAGIFRFVIGAASLLASIMVVYGGFRYLLGSTLGDIKAGKETIQNAVIGLIVLLCSYVILRSINPAIVTLRPLQLEYTEPVLAPPGSSQPPVAGAGAGAGAGGTGSTASTTPATVGTPVRKLPDAVDGLTGSQFSLQLLGIADPTVGATVLTAVKTGNFSQAATLTPRGSTALNDGAREAAIKTALTAGHYPQFLSNFIPVTVRAGGRTATFFVTPDVLAIGRDNDYLRIPMRPRTAQEIADHFQMLLPTKKMINAMMQASNFTHETVNGHDPYGGSRDHNYLYIRNNQEIQQQRNSHVDANKGYIGGKKDMFLTPNLSLPVATTADSSCPAPRVRKTLRIWIYGGFGSSGSILQEPTNNHSITYVDYSHGVHLVASEMIVDGNPKTVREVLASAELAPLISDYVIATPTYPLTAPTEVCLAS